VVGIRRLELTLALLVVATVAAAQTRDARPEDPNESQQRQDSRAAFRRGVSALEKQKWSEARDEFAHAYDLFPHPSILLDLGLARSHVGEWVQAEQDLTRFLAEDTGALPDELQTARITLESVRHHIGTVRVRIAPAGASATLDQKPVALAPSDLVDVRVAEGDHELVATAPDHETWRGHIGVDAGATKVVDLTLAPNDEKTAPRRGVSAQRVASYVTFGAGVAIAGFATFAGLHSIDLANEYNTPGNPSYQNPGTKSEGIDYRTAADVTFAIAGACVIAAAILYFYVPKKNAPVALGPLGVGFRF